MKQYELIMFDADGTLIDRETGEMLPNVWETLTQRTENFAIVSNQGGPACFEMGWGDKYPTLEKITKRLNDLGRAIGATVYVCYLWVGRGGKSAYPKSLGEYDHEAELFRRKPAPGMLLEAMAEFNTLAEKSLMVGDREEDQEAAENAGCAFMWADEFFKRGEYVTKGD